MTLLRKSLLLLALMISASAPVVNMGVGTDLTIKDVVGYTGRIEFDSTQPILTWAPVPLGLAIMFIPSFTDLFKGIWSTPAQGHGLMVLLVSFFLLYRQWPAMQVASKDTAPNAWGWPILVFGLLLYILGRSQDILLFEIGSLIWVLITYTWGDAAGQGFLHGFSGMVLFISALLLIIAIDSVIQFFMSRQAATTKVGAGGTAARA